jgi:hypothetical protein
MISRNWATNGHTGTVEPFVFRKLCTNDLIVRQENYESFQAVIAGFWNRADHRPIFVLVE